MFGVGEMSNERLVARLGDMLGKSLSKMLGWGSVRGRLCWKRALSKGLTICWMRGLV